MAFSFGKSPSSAPLFGGGTGGSAFGTQTQNQQPSQGSSNLFGTKPPAPGGGLFGSAPASQPQGGLFGNTSANQPQGGSLFGNNQVNASSGFFGSTQTNQPPASGLFGSTQTNATQSGGLFGNTQSKPASGGLFGNTQLNQQQANQPQSSGLFGNTQANQPSSGGLFGNAQANQPSSGSLFGNNQGNQPSSGGLFGNNQGNQSSSGGLFGNTQTSQPQTGLFGNTQTGHSQSGGLFGNTQASQAGQSGSLFGSTANQSSTTNPLGNTTKPPLFGSFGSAANTPVPPANTTGAAPLSQDAKLGLPLNVQLDRIRASWDTSNLATCQFQYYLYNRAPDTVSTQQLCIRRSDAVGPMHDALWQKAMQENPDPDRLYPVLAVGFNDLQTRSKAQHTETLRQRNKLAELSKQLAILQQRHDLSNAVRAQSAAMAQARIHQRLLKLLKDTFLLIPALRGQSLTASEDNLVAVLESCEAQLNGAAGTFAENGEQTRLRARINELWAQLGVVRARREAMQAQGRTHSGNTEWAVVDEAGFEELTSILAQLQQGLVLLTNTLTSDSKSLDTVCDGLTGVPLVGVRQR